MKKVGLFVTIICLLILMSCEPKINNNNSNDNNEIYDANISYNKLGDVNKIYTARNGKSIKYIPIPEEKTSRFFTGQKINNFRGYQVIFDACIVEYNSIDAVYLEYVENLENNNSLMHQEYENFTKKTVDPEKKYVEFASYFDVNTGRILFHEIRIFFGNFMDTYNNEFWYAKSVLFSPDLSIDVERKINIFTGEYDTYSPKISPNGITNSESAGYVNLEMKEVDKRTELMLRLGEINRVFAWFANGEFDYIKMFGGDEIKAECYLVELNNLSEELRNSINKNGTPCLHQREWTIESIEGKEYIELIYYNNLNDPSNSWTNLRLRTQKIDGTKYGYLAKEISL